MRERGTGFPSCRVSASSSSPRAREEGFVFRSRLEDTINICAFKCFWNMRAGCVASRRVVSRPVERSRSFFLVARQMFPQIETALCAVLINVFLDHSVASFLTHVAVHLVTRISRVSFGFVHHFLFTRGRFIAIACRMYRAISRTALASQVPPGRSCSSGSHFRFTLILRILQDDTKRVQNKINDANET